MIDDIKYAVVAAVDSSNGFARFGQIPWYFSEDFKHFRELTMGNICVMGRNTYNDINERMGEKGAQDVLPGRTNIVLSNTLGRVQNAWVLGSLDAVRDSLFLESRTVFFIGGEQIFKEGLELADEVYLTIVPGDYQCDSFFPELDLNTFEITSEMKTESGLTFIKAVRKLNN